MLSPRDVERGCPGVLEWKEQRVLHSLSLPICLGGSEEAVMAALEAPHTVLGHFRPVKRLNELAHFTDYLWLMLRFSAQ